MNNRDVKNVRRSRYSGEGELIGTLENHYCQLERHRALKIVGATDRTGPDSWPNGARLAVRVSLMLEGVSGAEPHDPFDVHCDEVRQ